MPATKTISSWVKPVLSALVIAGVLSGCSAAPMPSGIVDPLEAQNRSVHDVNRDIDRNLLRPVATAYGTILPAPIRSGISNFATNLNLPGMVLNDLLQFRLADAGSNTARFLVNSTIGIAGLIDVATPAGLTERSTDFGETLYVWGVSEGNYMELPILGPSTARHTMGRVVDTAINPLNFLIVNPERSIAAAAGVTARIGDRHRYTDLVDDILYESADSYAQSRLLYLQNRRFALTGTSQTEEFDPYEDVYGTQ